MLGNPSVIEGGIQNEAHSYDGHLTLSSTLGLLSRLTVVLVVACGAPAASTVSPSATASLGPVTYATVESSVQPAGSILVEMTNYMFKPADIPLTAGKVVLYLVNTSTDSQSTTYGPGSTA